jgi:CBS domain-containing protein
LLLEGNGKFHEFRLVSVSAFPHRPDARLLAVDFQLNLHTETVDRLDPPQPLCFEQHVPAREVLHAMKTRARGAAVICRQGVVAGIFTERDAVRLMASGANLDVPIEQVMARDPVVLSRTDSVGKAIATMSQGGYRRLPIVDEHGRPIGIVRVKQILHYLVQHFPAVIYTLPPGPDLATKEREGA